MDESFVEGFLRSFDDSRFPENFLKTYEPMECLADKPAGETLLVRHYRTGAYYIAKCYTDLSVLPHSTESELLRGLHYGKLPTFVEEYRNDKMICVVREYVQGVPLDILALEGRIPEQQAISICVQLCDILSYLHEQTPPVIHRDIKPQNIIMDENGTIKLIDFGISRVYNAGAQTDTVFYGTQGFAPPEQYGFSQTDNRSDIFSLGVLLCWLLTGKTDVGNAFGSIQNRRLAAVIKKCTAFSPKDRYADAAGVKEALTGRRTRRRAFAICSAAFAIAALVLSIFLNGGKLTGGKTAGIRFDEPLIEQAVRLSLSKDKDEKVTEEELSSITELFVFGDKAAENEEMYRVYSDRFVAHDRTVSRGGIRLLDDIAKLKNLRRLSLAYQNISDLTPLSQLLYLEHIDLKHNPIQDVSPLSQLASLNTLLLFDTRVSDLTSLNQCLHLTLVDVGMTGVASIAALNGLDSLQVLVIRKAPLKTIEQITSLPMLEQVYLSETPLQDLAPLLDLPRLKLVEVSENMRGTTQALSGKATFEITYQK